MQIKKSQFSIPFIILQTTLQSSNNAKNDVFVKYQLAEIDANT
jgi:hypothetical protein